MISSIDERMKITASQLLVLQLASKGLKIKEIADELGITKSAVSGRQKKTIKQNKCRNLTHLCCKAIRNGVIN